MAPAAVLRKHLAACQRVALHRHGGPVGLDQHISVLAGLAAEEFDGHAPYRSRREIPQRVDGGGIDIFSVNLAVAYRREQGRGPDAIIREDRCRRRPDSGWQLLPTANEQAGHSRNLRPIEHLEGGIRDVLLRG